MRSRVLGDEETRPREGGHDPSDVILMKSDPSSPRSERGELLARLRQQAAVADLGQRAVAGESLDRLMDRVATSVAQTLDVPLCKILEHLPGGDFLLRAGVGWKEGLVGKARVDGNRGSQAGFTLSMEGPVIVENLQAEDRFYAPKLLADHQVVSGISVIVAGQDKPFGVLGAHCRKRRRFTQDDSNFLQAVANVLAAAIDRKRSEEAVKASEERYRDLFENAIDVIYTHDMEGRFTSLNRAGEELSGYSRSEILRMSIYEVIAPNRRNEVRRLLKVELPVKRLVASEFEILTKDGRRLSLEANVRVLEQDGHLVGVEGIARDVTGRKKLEEQLRQSQKMQAVGQLAGGVAHDFNNLLTVIIGNAEILLERGGRDDWSYRELEEIRNTGLRAASLIRQLLAFSRKQIMQLRALDLNAVVTGVEGMLRRMIGEDVRLETSLVPGLPSVRTDPVHLEQVLVNLAVNARDAMPRGGKLAIETSCDELEADSVSGIGPGRYVVLTVRDTGVGIDPAVLPRIFEPFFTTKEQGRGSGLGLSTVYGIVEQSGAFIRVASEPGKGTAFRIYFRPSEASSFSAPLPPDPDAEAEKGSETVLVVEDEEPVRRFVVRTLEDRGYAVLAAEDGAAALELSRAHEGTIHLVLTDVVMPDMSGPDLVEALLGDRRGVRVLYMSGHSNGMILRHGAQGTGGELLQKPFGRRPLLTRVRQVLDAAVDGPRTTPTPA